MDHHSRLLMYTLVVAVFDLSCIVVRQKMLSRKAGQMLLTAVFFINSLLLPQISMTIFDTFPCQKFDGDYGSFLVIDKTIDCTSAAHGTMRAYALSMIFVFPVGMPLFSLFLLRKNSHKLDPGQGEIEKKHLMRHDSSRHNALKETIGLRDENEDIKHLRFLYESYEPKYWWYEVLEVYRKIVVTGGLRLLERGGGTQYGVALLICALSLRTIAAKKPYVTHAANRVSEIASWGVMLTMIGAMVTAWNERADGKYSEKSGLTDALLVFVQVGGILLAVAIAVYEKNVLVQERALEDQERLSDEGVAKVVPAEEIEMVRSGSKT